MPNNQTSSTPSVNPHTTTQRGKRAPKGVLRRLLRTLFEFYPVLLPVTMVCIVINAVVSSVPSVFMQISDRLRNYGGLSLADHGAPGPGSDFHA